ncbi:hypothetical protein [Micromonospora sp. NPDC049497]|uniref:hypothetical protein n=1 Tax=Micromonospora sp. NPDC049497 TaxID=3364273 RepID=UPI0037BBD352
MQRSTRTPINIFRTSDGHVAALTYGVTDWARNVLAAGSCELEIRGRRGPLTSPASLLRRELTRAGETVLSTRFRACSDAARSASLVRRAAP